MGFFRWKMPIRTATKLRMRPEVTNVRPNISHTAFVTP